MNDEPRHPDDAPAPESLSEMQAKLTAMEERIKEQKAASRQELENIHADYDQKMAALDKRLHAARKKETVRQEKVETSGIGGSGVGKSMGVGLTVAYGIMGGPIAGWLLGMAIDRQAGSGNAWQTGLVTLGAVMGIVFAIVVLQRHQK